MSERLRRADDRCRHCGRSGVDAHRADCRHAPDDPLLEDPPFDPDACDRAEDQYQAMLLDGHR